MAPRREVDPYAPPPMHHDRSGAVVRMAILAVLLGGGFLGWQYFSSHRQSAGLVGEEQQMADAGPAAIPETYSTPPSETAATETAPPPAAAPTPPPRRAATPRREAEPEPVPPPSTTIEPSSPPPAAATPIPPDSSTTGE